MCGVWVREMSLLRVLTSSMLLRLALCSFGIVLWEIFTGECSLQPGPCAPNPDTAGYMPVPMCRQLSADVPVLQAKSPTGAPCATRECPRSARRCAAGAAIACPEACLLAFSPYAHGVLFDLQAAVDLMDCCLSLNPSERPTAKQIVQLMESMPAETPGEAEKRGATLRAASLAEWRDQLPQQVSKFMPGSPSAQAEVGTSTWRTELTNDAEELEAAAERAEHGPPPAPPQATLRLEDMPPLSDADRIF